MKVLSQTEERIPEYALPYLINGDMSGLSNEDCHNIDQWLATYEQAGTWMDISPVEENFEGYFTHVPAFGLPCNVVDCKVTVFIPDTEEK